MACVLSATPESNFSAVRVLDRCNPVQNRCGQAGVGSQTSDTRGPCGRMVMRVHPVPDQCPGSGLDWYGTGNAGLYQDRCGQTGVGSQSSDTRGPCGRMVITVVFF